jgi:hypothetical protein
VPYIYTIAIPLKIQIEALEKKTRFGETAIKARDVNFVVEFENKTPLTQEDVAQAESALKTLLKGKPVSADTELIRCVTKIAASCMAESKPMLDRLYMLRPNFPKVQASVVLNGNLSWHEKRFNKDS